MTLKPSRRAREAAARAAEWERAAEDASPLVLTKGEVRAIADTLFDTIEEAERRAFYLKENTGQREEGEQYDVIVKRLKAASKKITALTHREYAIRDGIAIPDPPKPCVWRRVGADYATTSCGVTKASPSAIERNAYCWYCNNPLEDGGT